MFIFVRQDLPIAQQIVQTNHATFAFASIFTSEPGIPNIVLVGVPDVSALNRVLSKLKANQIPHMVFRDPDLGPDMTAIVTEPLDHEQKKCLSNYRLWKDTREEPGNRFAGESRTPAPDSPVTQLQSAAL